LSSVLSTPQGQLLRILADGGRHSGEQLAEALGVTRAAVWKQVAKLESWGLSVEATRGSGYLLARPIDFLSEADIVRELVPDVVDFLARIDVADELDSTNQALLEESSPAAGQLAVRLAEFQHAGRGRRGRTWVAPFGGGLCLSVGWTFTEIPRDLSALTLVTGLVIRSVILETTGVEVQLKWPNDLIWHDKKLGGVLVELKAESHGPCYVVVGIGINVSGIPAQLDSTGNWPGGVVDLYTATSGMPPPRNSLAARLIGALGSMLLSYSESGFPAYREEYAAADYLYGRQISVQDESNVLTGVAGGVDADGALRVNTGDGVERVIAGDVSVRMVR